LQRSPRRRKKPKTYSKSNSLRSREQVASIHPSAWKIRELRILGSPDSGFWISLRVRPWRFPIEPTYGDWYEGTLGSPEDVQSDCSTSQHARPVTVAMIRERAGGPARHRQRAPGRPARGRTAWRRVGPGQQPALRRSIQGPCTPNTSKKTFKPPRPSRYPQRALRCWAGRRGQ
jgi:hypothetical protein